jgi:tetratricopeptide (TPR) repeat protein
MLANGLYAEATPHVGHAVETLPRDPRLLFDSGCLAETYGLPLHQVLLADGHARHRETIGIPDADRTNASAEDWFRRALEADATFAEARVRLARLLDVHERHEQALAEIERALASQPHGIVAFYAHLFGGRAAQALGRMTDARRHYREALTLLPNAQSALIAYSHAALADGDMPATLAPMQTLRTGSNLIAADPWWYYHLGAGRDLDDLLADLWSRKAGP